MRVIRKILISLGVFFLLLLAFISFLGFGSANFREAKEPFVADFMEDISEDWDIGDVRFRLTNLFIEQVDSAGGRQAMQTFSQLGKIRSIEDLTLEHYSAMTSGKTGVFTFKASFQHGDAVVRMTVVEKDEKTQVQALNITRSQISYRPDAEDVET